MGSTFHIIKRVGATLVILVLILMMALIFSSQPIDEMLGTVMGGDSAGEYDGKPISLRDYAIYESQCQDWIASNKLGQNRFFLERCIDIRLRQGYVLENVGKRLGIAAVPEMVKREVVEEAKQEYNLQSSLDEEDRLPLSDIYRYSLSRFPIDVRMRSYSSSKAHSVLQFPFAHYPIQDKLQYAIKKTSVGLRLVYYQPLQLQDKLKQGIQVSQDEIMRLYQKEQKERQQQIAKLAEQNSGSQKNTPVSSLALKPNSRQIKSIRQRIQSNKAKRKLELIEQELKKMTKEGKAMQLELIASMLKTSVIQLPATALDKLSSIKIDKKTSLNLMQPQFLTHITAKSPQKQVIGPINSGPYIAYIQVKEVQYPSIALAKKGKTKRVGIRENKNIGYEFLNYIIEEESQRGNFKLKKINSQQP